MQDLGFPHEIKGHQLTEQVQAWVSWLIDEPTLGPGGLLHPVYRITLPGDLDEHLA